MALPIIAAFAGGGMLAGGTMMRHDANRRRGRALRGVTRDRENAMAGFNERRSGVMRQAMGSLPGFQQQHQGIMGQAIQGLGDRQGVYQGAVGDAQGRMQAATGQLGLPTSQGMRGDRAALMGQFQGQQQPMTSALQGLQAHQMGQTAMDRSTGNIMRQAQLGGIGLDRQLQDFRGQMGLAQGQIGLEDLLNQLYTQQRLGNAQQVGGRTEAFGQLFQQLGSAGLQAGMQGMTGPRPT